MPKANSDTTEVPKRAPRRRVPRKTTRVGATEEATLAISTPTVRRKSPTSFATPAQKNPQKNYAAYVPAAVLLVSAVAAVLIGVSDAGQIDIQELVANQNTQTQASNDDSSGESSTMTIPVQNNPSTVPGGGLLPSADQSVPTPTLLEASDTASTTASSTDTTASTTEPVAAEGDDTTNEAVPDSTLETNVEETSGDTGGQ